MIAINLFLFRNKSKYSKQKYVPLDPVYLLWHHYPRNLFQSQAFLAAENNKWDLLCLFSKLATFIFMNHY